MNDKIFKQRVLRITGELVFLMGIYGIVHGPYPRAAILLGLVGLELTAYGRKTRLINKFSIKNKEDLDRVLGDKDK